MNSSQTTAQVYRQAIDDTIAGKEFDNNLVSALDGLANRGYTEGFLRRHRHSDYQNYEYGASKTDQQQFAAEVIGFTKERLTLDIKNKLEVGNTIEIMTPQGNTTFTLTEMWDKKGNAIDVAPGSGWQVQIPNPSLIMKNVEKPIYT